MIAKQRGELFRPKHQSLLMTKLVKACVLQILDVDVDHLAQQKEDRQDGQIIAPGAGSDNLADEALASTPPT